MLPGAITLARPKEEDDNDSIDPAASATDVTVVAPPLQKQGATSTTMIMDPTTDGNPLFLYILTACSTIGGFLFGYDTGVISGALVLLKSPQVFDLSDFQSESVVSAAICGAIVGASCSSYGTHFWGRKPVILISSTLFLLGSLVMGFAQSFSSLLLGRLIVGIGIGCSSMTVPLYIAEVSPPQMRGQLVSLNTLLVTGGQFFASVLSASLSTMKNGWRLMLGLAAVPAFLQLLGFLVLPESPRFLLSKGKTQEAWQALVRIRGTQAIESEYNAMEADVKRQHKPQQEDSESEEIQEGEIYKRPLAILDQIRHQPAISRALFLGCFLQALQQLCGINTVMYYGATILQMAGFNDPSQAIWLSAVVAFSNFAFTFVGIYLVDRVGRRLLTLASLAGVVLSLVALGGSFYIAQATSTPTVIITGAIDGSMCGSLASCFDCVANSQCGFCQQTTSCMPGDATGTSGGMMCGARSWHFSSCPQDSKAFGYLIVVSLFIYLACFASGMGSTPWTINAEIYPLHVRSFCLSMATSVNWISNLVVSFTFLTIINSFHAYGAFWLYALIATLGFVVLYVELPETKGLTLEEIQEMFERRTNYTKLEKQSS